MKYLFLFAIVLSCSTLFGQDEICKGQIFEVPKWRWVTYENAGLPQLWSNTVTYSKIGDRCGIGEDGTLTVIGHMDDGFVLCLYNTSSKGLGTRCEDGVICVLPVDEISTYNIQAKANKDAAERKRKRIKELISQF